MDIQFPDFSKAKVLVIGDVMLDRYFHGDTTRISPEAPIPVVRIKKMEDRLGGAAHVAFNISSLCASAKLLGLIGSDTSTAKLKTCLKAAQVEHEIIEDPDAATVTKLRVISQHQQLLRLDFEDGFQSSLKHQLFERYQQIIANFNAVVISDYGKGTLFDTRAYIEVAQEHNIPVFVDPKSTNYTDYEGATIITPNRKEFEAVVGPCQDEATLVAKAHDLIKAHRLGALLVTRGAEGMTLVQDGAPEIHIPTHAKEVFDVTGAGDTVVGVLAASVAAGQSLEQAVRLSNVAAGITVSKLGAASVTEAELIEALDHKQFWGVLNEDQLLSAIADAHERGEKIIMTNGCFDILHAGHVHYLAQAKKLGDRLIVAVNDDASVKRLKGATRPINALERRMAVLAGLGAVDWVVPFSEDTPERLICKLLPDILVKGGDYSDIQTIAGSQCVIKNGGSVELLDFIDGCSTTSLIEKMQEQHD